MHLPKFLIVPAALLGLLSFEQSASAQATRTWVSGVGDDVNPCSRTAPCKTYAGAISKTAAGGEINCLDPAGYGTLTITKSITVSCKYTHGSTLNSGGINGFVINGDNVEVVLRGLSINGAGSTPGLNGIKFVKGASLTVENVDIQNSRSGNGILLEHVAGHVRLTVINTVIVNNGNGSTGAGIQIQPTGTGSAEVSIDNTQVLGNSHGIRADARNSTGNIQIDISNSAAKHSRFHGFVALGGTGRVQMMLDGVVASHNDGEGVRAVGPNVGLRMGRSTVSYNAIGITAANSGNITSYGTNQIDGNTVDGFTPPVGAQK